MTSFEMELFKRTERYIRFDHKKEEEILEELKLEPVDEKPRRQIKLTTTSTNKEQQDAKYNVEL